MSDAETEEVSLDSDGNEGDAGAMTYDLHDFEKKLIEEVKQRPFLFDHTDGGFKDLKRKDSTWVQIAEAIGVSVNKCQCRWKSLRDRYVRESRKMREGNGPKRHLWAMFKYLTFLDEIPRLNRRPYLWTPTTTTTKAGRVVSSRPASVFLVPSSSSTPTSSSSTSSSSQVQLTVSSASAASIPPALALPPPPSVAVTPSVTVTPAASAVTNSPASMLTVQLTENPSSSGPQQGVVVTRKAAVPASSVNGGIPVSSAQAPVPGHILTTFVDMADGCSAFGMSVSATLRTLPLEQQELAKLRIQQVLYEVQFS